MDVIEIDGAQHTGVDSTKELIASCMYAPTTVKYKVIIADEFQMLSKSSFAALLKTLEEPPPHLKFVFCTTEVKKIPITIISRCQRFDLHRVSIKDLLENLNKVLNYYVYCHSGIRSVQACQIMKTFGINNVYNLLGGISEWDGPKVEE